MSKKRLHNRLFVYQHSYAPIWSLLTEYEKKQVLFERAANYMVFREARLFVNSGKYGQLAEMREEPIDLALEEENLTVEPFDEDDELMPFPSSGIESPERAKKIYDAVVANPRSSLAKLAEEVNISGKQVSMFLRKLSEAGVIRHCGTKRHESNNKPGKIYEAVRKTANQYVLDNR